MKATVFGTRLRVPRPTTSAALGFLVAVGLGACEGGPAYGDVNSIIVAAAPDVWEQVEDTVKAALEPTILAVRDEQTFTVTYQNPAAQGWDNLRRFRQVLLIGTGEEPWMQRALEELEEVPPAPAMVQVDDVWARGQQISLLLVPPGGAVEAVSANVDELHKMYDRQYRAWAVNRMYMSGRDSALADTLHAQAGFSLMVPEVYARRAQDSVYMFRNDNPDPSELIRQVSVTWKSPIPSDMQPEGLLAWRAAVVDAYYSYPQAVRLDTVDAGPFQYRGHDAYQIQAAWRNPPGDAWPAAGPFILRSVICREQDRMYLLDAWLYAPSRSKYEYMIQLNTILDSFRCGAAGIGGAPAAATPPPARGPRATAPPDTMG